MPRSRVAASGLGQRTPAIFPAKRAYENCDHGAAQRRVGWGDLLRNHPGLSEFALSPFSFAVALRKIWTMAVAAAFRNNEVSGSIPLSSILASMD